ncbi:hypothetical protein [Streptomyces beijiangensis]|uniref:Lipoprotein n=1 Tax=Streptomyces beijiangensis TaxID=163361 RepID=A0A939F8U1_9ACTN|nr:hypothetical protein [Streptomyces beijiangensis]MBO0513744.1 hypothetical protein [Streptomyces beijiangensis]
MKITRTLIVGAASAALLAIGCTAAFAKPDPNEAALEKATHEVVLYFCDNDHDDAFYHDWRTAEAMTNWAFRDGIEPHDVARGTLSTSENEDKKLAGMESPLITDDIRTMMCKTHKDAYLDEVLKVTEANKAGLKPEYVDSDAAIKALPQKKLEAFQAAIAAEKSRNSASPSPTPTASDSPSPAPIETNTASPAPTETAGGNS